jgi:hypothetical protein
MADHAFLYGQDETPEGGSYGEAIRNRFLYEVTRLPFFASFMPRITKALPIQPDDLPILGCYLGEETMAPDGDWDMGPLAFVTNIRINWSIMVAESDKIEAERRLERAYVALLYGLWCNPSVTSLWDTTDYETGEATAYNARFEGVMRQSARTVWGAFMLNNETPVAEKQYEITLQYRRIFTPGPFHDLNEVQIDSSFPVYRTPEERERIQQIRQVLLFTSPPPLKEKPNG